MSHTPTHSSEQSKPANKQTRIHLSRNPIAIHARKLGISFKRVYTQKRATKLYNVNPLLAAQSVRQLQKQLGFNRRITVVSVDAYPATTSILVHN